MTWRYWRVSGLVMIFMAGIVSASIYSVDPIWVAGAYDDGDYDTTALAASSPEALVSPLPHLRFCPTGGITAATAERYLRLPNVGCVGGSWLTPADALVAGDWARITRLAAEVALPIAA
jgi:hypothetical protein